MLSWRERNCLNLFQSFHTSHCFYNFSLSILYLIFYLYSPLPPFTLFSLSLSLLFFFFFLLQNNTCRCYPWAYHSGRLLTPHDTSKANVSCDTMREIECAIRITSPESQCSEREMETNENAYCLNWEKGAEIELEFGLQCQFTAGNITNVQPNV